MSHRIKQWKRKRSHTERGSHAHALYKAAGVDTRGASEYASQFFEVMRETWSQQTGVNVMDSAHFAGLFSLEGEQGRFWAASVDGVGTKSRMLAAHDKLEVVGWDCVAMNVNDILVTGAEPLVFMNYLGVEDLGSVDLLRVVEGMADAMKHSGGVMVGGETAMMRGLYQEGEFEAVGFCLGSGTRRWDLSQARAGDHILALASWGVHSNGYSMLHQEQWSAQMQEVLLKPTRIYGSELRELELREGVQVIGAIHITGGGLLGRLGILSEHGLTFEYTSALPSCWWMDELCERFGLEWEDGASIWNAGVGMVCVVRSEKEGECLDKLDGGWFKLGRIM